MTIHVAYELGPRLADGEVGACYRLMRLDPLVISHQEVTVDFTGVRSANSAFMNALLAGLVEEHGDAVLSQLVFTGCNATLRVLIDSAVELGRLKAEERSRART